MARPPVHKIVVALIIVLPVTIVWAPWVLPVLWKIGGSLVDEVIRARASALDTAAYFLWALFGLLGIAGLWLWVISPRHSRRQRFVVGVFILLGILAALPWAVGGIRHMVWQALLLVAPCLLGLAVLVVLLRPNGTPHTDPRASAAFTEPPPSRAGERGR